VEPIVGVLTGFFYGDADFYESLRVILGVLVCNLNQGSLGSEVALSFDSIIATVLHIDFTKLGMSKI
jgi:hypothetical protein